MTTVAFPTDTPRDQWSTIRDSCEIIKESVDLWRDRFRDRGIKTLERVVIMEVSVVCTGEARRYDVTYEVAMEYPACLTNTPDVQVTSFSQKQIEKYRVH